MRARKLVTEAGSLGAPGDFLFIPVVVRESNNLQPPLKIHLVSTFLACSYHFLLNHGLAE